MTFSCCCILSTQLHQECEAAKVNERIQWRIVEVVEKEPEATVRQVHTRCISLNSHQFLTQQKWSGKEFTAERDLKKPKWVLSPLKKLKSFWENVLNLNFLVKQITTVYRKINKAGNTVKHVRGSVLPLVLARFITFGAHFEHFWVCVEDHGPFCRTVTWKLPVIQVKTVGCSEGTWNQIKSNTCERSATSSREKASSKTENWSNLPKKSGPNWKVDVMSLVLSGKKIPGKYQNTIF